MTELEPAPEPTPDPPPEPAQTQARSSDSDARKPAGRGLAWLALVVGLAALAGLVAAGWFGWQAVQDQANSRSAIDERVATLDRALAALRDASGQNASRFDVERIDRRVGEMVGRIDAAADTAGRPERVDALDQRLAQITTELARVRIDTGAAGAAQAERARMLGVEQLLAAAQMQALVSRDYPSAIAVLEAAADALRELSDRAELAVVRERIATDIEALRTAAPVDRAALLGRLEGVAGAVMALPGRETLRERAGVSTGSDSAAGRPLWRQLLDDAWAGLRSLVVIRRADRPVEPLPSPELEALDRRGIAIQIDIAQLAAARGDAASFSAALGRARDGLTLRFNPDDPAVTRLTESITELMQVDLDAPPPQVGAGLTALRAVLSERRPAHRAPVVPAAPEPTENPPVGVAPEPVAEPPPATNEVAAAIATPAETTPESSPAADPVGVTGFAEPRP